MSMALHATKVGPQSTKRIQTPLIALGTAYRGYTCQNKSLRKARTLAHSAAVIAVISVPIKAKAALMSTEKKPKKRPFAPAYSQRSADGLHSPIPAYCTNPPVSCQNLNPMDS